MSDPNYRGTLSAYAKWAGITLNCAKARNRRGRIVFCDDFPHLIDFLATQRIQRGRGRPQTRPRIYIFCVGKNQKNNQKK